MQRTTQALIVAAALVCAAAVAHAQQPQPVSPTQQPSQQAPGELSNALTNVLQSIGQVANAGIQALNNATANGTAPLGGNGTGLLPRGGNGTAGAGAGLGELLSNITGGMAAAAEPRGADGKPLPPPSSSSSAGARSGGLALAVVAGVLLMAVLL